MKALTVLCLSVVLLAGCGAKQEISMPSQSVGAIKESEVTQMGGFGANLPKGTSAAPAGK